MTTVKLLSRFRPYQSPIYNLYYLIYIFTLVYKVEFNYIKVYYRMILEMFQYINRLCQLAGSINYEYYNNV